MWLAFTTGKRRGDLCGLRWTDVDIESGLATFGPAIKQAGTEIYTGDPKGKRHTPARAIDAVRGRARCG